MLYNTKIHLLIQVCEALQYLHDQGWIHCAITSHAIYMVSPTIAHLGGLCYAKKRDSVNPCISTPPIVWNRWLPIEVIRGTHRIGTKSDVYSICTIIHEILTGSPPWANVDDHDVRNLLSTGYQHPVDDCVSESLSGILHVGLAVKARHRHLCLQDILNTLQSEHTASIKKSTCCYSDATILQDIPLSRTTLHTAAKNDPFNICSEIPEKLLESQNQHDNHGETGEMRWCAWRKEHLQELLTCTNEFFTSQRILSTHVVNEDPDISDSSTDAFERNMDSLVDTYKPQSSSEDGESATEPPNDTTCSSPTHQMWDMDSVQDDTHNPHIQDTTWHMSVTRSRDSRTENVSHWQSAQDIQPKNITIKQTSDIQKSESCDRSLYKSFLQDDEDQDSIDTERKESQSFPPKDLGSDETFKFKETVIEAAHVSVLEDKTASEQFLLVCRSPMAFEDISEISSVVSSDTAGLPLTSHKALLLHFPQSTPVNREMKLKIIRLKNRETAASLGHDYSLNESNIWTMKRNAAEKMAQHVDLEIEDDDQVDNDGWLQYHTVGDIMEDFKEKTQFVAAGPDDGKDLKNSGSITDTMMNSAFLTPEGIELPLTEISGAEGALLRGSLGYDDNYPLSPTQPKDFSVKNKQDEQTAETSDKPFAEKTTEHVDLEIEDVDQDDDDGWLQYHPVGDIMEDVKEKTQFVAANPDDSEDSKNSRSITDTMNSVFLTPRGIEPTLTEISGAEGALLRGSLGYDDNYPLSPAQLKDFSVKNKQDEQTAETSDKPFAEKTTEHADLEIADDDIGLDDLIIL